MKLFIQFYSTAGETKIHFFLSLVQFFMNAMDIANVILAQKHY